MGMNERTNYGEILQEMAIIRGVQEKQKTEGESKVKSFYILCISFILILYILCISGVYLLFVYCSMLGASAPLRNRELNVQSPGTATGQYNVQPTRYYMFSHWVKYAQPPGVTCSPPGSTELCYGLCLTRPDLTRQVNK